MGVGLEEGVGGGSRPAGKVKDSHYAGSNSRKTDHFALALARPTPTLPQYASTCPCPALPLLRPYLPLPLLAPPLPLACPYPSPTPVPALPCPCPCPTPPPVVHTDLPARPDPAYTNVSKGHHPWPGWWGSVIAHVTCHQWAWQRSSPGVDLLPPLTTRCPDSLFNVLVVPPHQWPMRYNTKRMLHHDAQIHNYLLPEWALPHGWVLGELRAFAICEIFSNLIWLESQKPFWMITTERSR